MDTRFKYLEMILVSDLLNQDSFRTGGLLGVRCTGVILAGCRKGRAGILCPLRSVTKGEVAAVQWNKKNEQLPTRAVPGEATDEFPGGIQSEFQSHVGEVGMAGGEQSRMECAMKCAAHG